MLDTGTPFRNVAIVLFKDLLINVENDLICSITYRMHALLNNNHITALRIHMVDKPSANHPARTDGFVF